MVGDADRTISPSSVSTSRSTPCVLGCWGPMLTVIVSVRRPDSSSFTSLITGVIVSATAGQPIAFDVDGKLFLCDLQRLGHMRRPADLHRRVFSQGKALPVFGHQQTPRIRMVIKGDAEQIPHLALEPVGR